MKKKNILKKTGVLTALALFSLISWGAVASAVDLTVISLHDSCDPDSGVHTYTDGDPVTCSVDPPVVSGGTGIQYVCTGWTGTGSVPASGEKTSVTFTMRTNSRITWNWKTQYQLTTHVEPPGSGTITPPDDSWHDAGNIEVEATANPGYLFDYWTDDLSGTDNPDTLNMNGPKIVTANFVSGYTLTVTSEHGSCSPDSGVHTYTDGDPVTCSVTSPVSGGTGIQYVCTGWTGTGSVPGTGTGTTTTFNISENSTIIWNWKIQYQLTTHVEPPGSGTITPASGTWHDAGDITVTANPEGEYAFVNWTDDLSGTDNPATLNMNGPKSVTANFGVRPPTGAVTKPSADALLDGCLDVFVDGDGTTTTSPGTQDAILPDAPLVYFKTTDKVCWCDADHSNTWTTITGTEDSLWIDANGNEKYDSGENVIVGSPVVGAGGMTLTSDYLFAYSNANSNGNYDSGEDIYYEKGDGNWYLHYSPGKYTIEYNADDEDEGELTLTLYADTNKNPDDGFAFTIRTHTVTLPPFPPNIPYDWDVSDVPSGSYYICLKIDDGTSASPVYEYSAGKITINRYPNVKVSNPTTDISVWENYTINFVATDSDNNPAITLYYDTDTNPSGFAGTIATGLHKTDTSSIWDISSVPKNVPYYICARITDPQGREPYYNYSKGCVTCIDEPELKLSVTSTYTTIDLYWWGLTTPTPDTLTLYRGIYRNGTFVSHDYDRISLSASATSYQDTIPTTNYEDRIYYYVVASYADDAYGPFTSNTVNEMLIPFPPNDKPTKLDAVSGIGVVSLSWDDNSTDETGFYIERKKKGIDYSYAYIGSTTTGSTNYDDRTITAGESYYYRIRAYKTYPDTENTKAAEYSNEAFIDTLPPIGGLLGKEGGGTGCFIATAAFGTPMAKEVRSFCKFRDEVLLKDPLGREFVKFYYAVSPPIAEFIRNRPGLKAMVREALKPLVWFSKTVLNEN